MQKQNKAKPNETVHIFHGIYYAYRHWQLKWTLLIPEAE